MIKKEDACKELTAKMTANGEKLNISPRTMQETIENLLPALATEETDLSDFVSRVLPIIKTVDNNARKDKSDFVNSQKGELDALKEQIKKLEEAKGKKEPPKEDDPNKDLREKLAAMEARFAAQDKEKDMADKRKQLAAKLKETIKNDKWLEKEVSRYPIGENFDLEDAKNDITETYNLIAGAIDPNFTPGGSGKHTASGVPAFDNFKKGLEAEKEKKKNRI